MERLKQEGNDLFSQKDFRKALIVYGNAIKISSSLRKSSPDISKRNELLCILHSNSGACHLELGNFLDCVDETTKSLNINPHFAKSLWRRSQANQKLLNWSDAVRGTSFDHMIMFIK